MNHQHIFVADALIDIEKELRELRLWDLISPAPEALSSTQPFAIDTLTFPQWLQFIFLPRLYAMIEQKLPLPVASGVAPMAEEYFRVLAVNSAPLISHLKRIDKLLSESI